MKTTLFLISAGAILWALAPRSPEPRGREPVAAARLAAQRSAPPAPKVKTAASVMRLSLSRPAAAAAPTATAPPAPAVRELTPHDDRMTDWLLETGQRVQSLHVREIERRYGRRNSLVIEGTSDEGHSLKEHVDAEGRLIADEVIFRDGRKLSRLYYPDGKFKAVYFEQNAAHAYSSTFDEQGQTVEVTELTPNGKQTRRNSHLN